MKNVKLMNLKKEAKIAINAMVMSVSLIASMAVCPINSYALEEETDERMTIEDMAPVKMYATASVNLRDIPTYQGNYLGTLAKDSEVNVVAKVTDNIWNNYIYYITDTGAFVHGNYVTTVKPENVQLPVANIFQNPDLPNGCEVTSLSIVMNYKGYAVDKCDMADNYLPKCSTLEGNPEIEYLRNPRKKGGTDGGFYCFATCICNTIDNYNNANGTEISYENLTGSDVSRLYEEIDKGNPCVVWGTLKWRTPKKYNNGLYSNLHCMVLSGYTNATVTIIDPIYGDTVINRNTFETVWCQMGQRAVVLY